MWITSEVFLSSWNCWRC